MLLQNSVYRPTASPILTALPRAVLLTVCIVESIAASIASSTSSDSLPPSSVKNLMPLSVKELWEALMTIPAVARRVRVR